MVVVLVVEMLLTNNLVLTEVLVARVALHQVLAVEPKLKQTLMV
jgi:hypothetical protein